MHRVRSENEVIFQHVCRYVSCAIDHKSIVVRVQCCNFGTPFFHLVSTGENNVIIMIMIMK